MRGVANHSVIEALHEEIRSLEGGKGHRRAVLPFGVEELDRRLPQGGLMISALHEVAGGGNGAVDGVAAALFAAGIAARTRGKVLWCVTHQDLFAPATAQADLSPDRGDITQYSENRSLLRFERAIAYRRRER